MTPRARDSDPQTSHDAAMSVKDTTGLQNRILGIFGNHNGLTDEELIVEYARLFRAWWPATDSSIRSRRSELVGKGLLQDTGVRRKTVAGRDSTVWDIFGRLF